MTAPSAFPVAIWSWKTDQGHWHAYSDALSIQLEDAHQNKVTRFPVDAERFVDTVKMEQRRLDLTGKARQVKRELQPALKAFTFAIIGAKPSDELVDLISTHGGIVTMYVTEMITHVLCEDNPTHTPDLQEAVAMKKPLLKHSAIKAIIKDRHKADLTAHIIHAVTGSDNPGPGSSKPAASPVASQTTAPKKVAPQVAGLPVPVGTPWKNEYGRPLDSNTEWLGALVGDDTLPEAVALDVLHVSSSGIWHGILKLPTKSSNTSWQVSGVLLPLGGPPTESGEASHTLYMKIDARIHGNDAKLAENSIFKGHLDASTKSAKISKNALSLSLSYLRHFPAAPLAFLQPGTHWTGRAITDVGPFAMHIDKTEKRAFSGTINWPDLGVTTSFKGQHLPDGSTSFEETGIVSQPDGEEVELPNTSYKCKPRLQLTSDAPAGSITHCGEWLATAEGGSDGSTSGVFMLSHEQAR